MMAAYRLKGLGWFLSVVIVSLGFYLVSLQVAQERKKLDDTGRAIAQAHRDLRALETEFQTRANLAQLEKWNGDVLALAAPVAAQYLSGESALASLDFRAGTPQAPVQMAALIIPAGPVDQLPAPVAAPASAPAPAASAPAASVAVASRTAPAVEAPVATVRRAVENVRVAAADRARTQAVAMLDRKLLSDSTLGDLLNGARNEATRRR
jgi:hypothetical protein